MKAKGAVIGICIADLILLVACIFLYLGQDRTAPVISFGENDIVYTEGMDMSILLNDVSAMDDEDGDVTDTLLIEKISDTAQGDVLVTYAALDRSDNVAKASRIFPVEMNRENQEDSRTEATESEEDSPETASETQTASEDGQEGGNGGEDGGEEQDNRGEEQGERQDGNDGQAHQEDGPDNPDENGQNDAGADRNQADGGQGNAAPVLRLSKDVLTVKAGAESVNWNDCIRNLSDDKDSRAQLFSNLVMEGQVDLGTAGEYPVTIYTRDSDGVESEKRNVVVRVEG